MHVSTCRSVPGGNCLGELFLVFLVGIALGALQAQAHQPWGEPHFALSQLLPMKLGHISAGLQSAQGCLLALSHLFQSVHLCRDPAVWALCRGVLVTTFTFGAWLWPLAGQGGG